MNKCRCAIQTQSVFYAGSFGTMLVFIACADGLIACADDVSHDLRHCFGTAQKIFEHRQASGRTILYACAGLANWGPDQKLQPEAGDPRWARWDSIDELRTYVEALEEDEPSPTQPGMLGLILQRRMVQYLGGIPPSNLPPAPNNPEGVLFEAVYYAASADRLVGEYAAVKWDPANCKVWSDSRVIQPLEIPEDRILVMGVTEIYERLLDGSDPELKHFRSDPALHPLLADSRLAVVPSLDAAAAAAVRLIRVATSVCQTIGPPKQCILLTATGECTQLNI